MGSTLKRWRFLAYRNDHKTPTIQGNQFVLIVETIGKPQNLHSFACKTSNYQSLLAWKPSDVFITDEKLVLAPILI